MGTPSLDSPAAEVCGIVSKPTEKGEAAKDVRVTRGVHIPSSYGSGVQSSLAEAQVSN